jgi:magnesium transporter
MLTIFKKRRPPVGARPGTLVVPEGAPTRIRVFEYDPEGAVESTPVSLDELVRLRDGARTAWIDVQGLGDEAMLRRLAEIFSIHPLALEDLVNAPQRPKVEEYDGQLLFIARTARLPSADDIELEQVGVVIGAGYVLTFQERRGDVLDLVRTRIREGKGKIRGGGAGYLGYAIIDTIVDGYYPVVEALGERLEHLELRVLDAPIPATLAEINRTKAQLVIMRRGLWPQREAVSRMIKQPTPLLSDDVRLYLRDTDDHGAQLVDVVDSQRELVNGLMNTYLSAVANRTNEVMKVLTIMSSIFIPLTFLAGIYGMNFADMPELHARWGYPVLLGVMTALGIGMLLYFRRQGWLGGSKSD